MVPSKLQPAWYVTNRSPQSKQTYCQVLVRRTTWVALGESHWENPVPSNVRRKLQTRTAVEMAASRSHCRADSCLGQVLNGHSMAGQLIWQCQAWLNEANMVRAMNL